jgi:hypothetical protein
MRASKGASLDVGAREAFGIIVGSLLYYCGFYLKSQPGQRPNKAERLKKYRDGMAVYS